jgi:hypothetical protein
MKPVQRLRDQTLIAEIGADCADALEWIELRDQISAVPRLDFRINRNAPRGALVYDGRPGTNLHPADTGSGTGTPPVHKRTRLTHSAGFLNRNSPAVFATAERRDFESTGNAGCVASISCTHRALLGGATGLQFIGTCIRILDSRTRIERSDYAISQPDCRNGFSNAHRPFATETLSLQAKTHFPHGCSTP